MPDRTIVITLGRANAAAYLAAHLLKTSSASKVVVLESNKKLKGRALEIAKFPEVRFIPLSKFSKPTSKVDYEGTIREIESRCSMLNLWHWVANDKQLSVFAQKGMYFNRKGQFTHSQLINRVQVSYGNIKAFIDEHEPDVVIGHDIVNLNKAMVHALAAERGARNVYLLPTRIKNYLAISSSPFEQFVDAKLLAETFSASDSDSPFLAQADAFINDHLSFQRQFHDSSQLGTDSRTARINSCSSAARCFAASALAWINGITRKRAKPEPGLHIEEFRRGWEISKTKLRRFRISATRSRASKQLTVPGSTGNRTVLFPLHSEPETALSLYAPHLPSQQALIDVVARSLPFDATLCVKDHPRMHSLRPASYYRDIVHWNPNVKLIPPDMDILPNMPSADCVVTIAGTTGLEALMFGKPVVTLGACHYQHLYGVTPVRNLLDLPLAIKNAIETPWNAATMRRSVKNYIAACMATGYPIGWWSDVDDSVAYDYESPEFTGFCSYVCRNLTNLHEDDGSVLDGFRPC